MLGVETSFNYDGINRLITVVGGFTDEVKKIARVTFSRKVNLLVLAALRKTPKRRYWTKDDWESDAQRRAFFAKTGGKAYERTGNYARGFRADIIEDETSITFGYANSVPYAGFVGGGQQQRGHIKTGWPNKAEVFTVQQPRAITAFSAAFDAYFDEQIEG